MNRSIRLFTVKGIDIRVHFTFPLILLWAALQFGSTFGSVGGALFGVVAISLLFALVTLHELGHSFAARMYGIPVKQIVLSPIGGVAQLARMPEKPIQELVISVAGPAVNVAMAFLITALGFAFGLDLVTLTTSFTGAATVTVAALISYLFVSNLFLAAFNLIPAFPMDGGRILRALLAMRLDYARATDIAVMIGRAAAVLFGIYGLMNGGFFMIFIAFFIFTAAGQEAKYARVKQAFDGFTVQQAYSSSAYRLEPNYSLQQAQSMAMYTGQREFPVVEGDRLAGYLTGADLRNALRGNPAYVPVSMVMDRTIRPVTPDTGLFEVQQRLIEESKEGLPVVADSGSYVGMITLQHIADILRVAQTPPIIPGTPRA